MRKSFTSLQSREGGLVDRCTGNQFLDFGGRDGTAAEESLSKSRMEQRKR